MIDISILSIIISKFYYKNKLCPIILFKVNKSPKIGFYYTILSFSLTVCLWIKDSKKFLPNIQKII